ncbi:Putative glycosyltransferase EpsF [Neobacillus rhizosphaerae]|uniref:Glycosyltransferase EpsF n=1 Tax=Neobacillus rhizosphaerae TaxID=2880965 RepID=A0ABN8KWB9_9BACI|nr:glycosyltransferase family 1 protein [Neobacillus rhizosphaerae]CAH2716772.1 Putative glycosyltransferase EpsF [Neobacillus rhizosphaerae]
MAEPIRILQVFALMNKGGAETMIMNFYRNIDRSKIQFDFIVHSQEECDYDKEIRALGGNIYNIPRYTGKNHFQFKMAWQNFFKEHTEYKIIHGHVRSTASIYLKIAKKYGLITIAHSHSTSSGNGASALVKNILQYPIRHTADYLFACSKVAGNWLFGKGASKRGNFVVLNNAIETKKFAYNERLRITKRRELQLENKFVIGHIGRFITPKNHKLLIDIFKEIHDISPNAVLLLIGEGELKKSIVNKVNDMGLSNSVIFTGVRSDISELLQAMDVFLFPSLYEGLPVTLIEAQASGLKIFASNTITEEVFITDLVNYCSLKSTPNEWANRVLNGFDENINRSRSFTEVKSSNYDIEENAKWLENFYLNIYVNSKKGVNNG